MNPITIAVLFGGLLLFMLAGVPLAFSIFGISTVALSVFTQLPVWQLIQRFLGGIDSFVLTAIPFFLLVGNIMNEAKITDRIIRVAAVLVGRAPGGLAQINVLDSLMFGGISGSAVADVSGLGTITIPAMIKEGYPTSFSVAITVLTSVLGQIIPPSLIMIIYASTASVSIQALFIAGIVPGVLFAVTMMVVCYVYAVKYNWPREERCTWPKFKQALKDALPVLAVPVIIMGGVLGGVFTATESAAVAVVYCIFVSIYGIKTLTWKDMVPILIKTAKGTATSLLCIGAASAFGYLVAFFRTSAFVSDMMNSMHMTQTGYVLFVTVLFLILGCFMDATPAICIFVPIILPAGLALGMHPVHIGLIVCLVLAFGMVTPPYGLCLLLGCQIAQIEPQKTFKDLFVLLSAVLVTYIIIVLLPDFVLWLPNLLVPKFM